MGLLSYAKSATVLANLTTYRNFTQLMGGLNSIKAGRENYVGLAKYAGLYVGGEGDYARGSFGLVLF